MIPFYLAKENHPPETLYTSLFAYKFDFIPKRKKK